MLQPTTDVYAVQSTSEFTWQTWQPSMSSAKQLLT